jgi:hypothetical protein
VFKCCNASLIFLSDLDIYTYGNDNRPYRHILSINNFVAQERRTLSTKKYNKYIQIDWFICTQRGDEQSISNVIKLGRVKNRYNLAPNEGPLRRR